MDYLRSDDEQAELLKQWLKKNGLGLIIAASIGVGSVFGYQEWQDFQINQQTDAVTLSRADRVVSGEFRRSRY